jgi:hypothetical protein
MPDDISPDRVAAIATAARVPLAPIGGHNGGAAFLGWPPTDRQTPIAASSERPAHRSVMSDESRRVVIAPIGF